MTKNVKKVIGIAFLLIGMVFLSIPIYHEWSQGKEVRALENALSLISESDGKNIDLSKIENLSFTEDEVVEVLELEIPSIDLKQYVLNKTTEENLTIALTQIKDKQTPGVGNFTIAGHRGYRPNRHFNRLSEVEIGDEVLLHTPNRIYIYKVFSTKVIEPTDVAILDDQEGKTEITLITCTITGERRVAVKGELIEILDQ
ncbi:class D sortase [Ornithinibacillus massiliensis]|uniref:Class D sortase n=1 Tax=Ornithinibacillus massiliensis TaxID=1944633 RepID=A0ABS5MEC6_9BACI|nr:class D sortase [Ornithinibacillus massiliensis]MBS3680686.1 class D sortase [Ornithinibacillus massiliensis]